MHVSYEHRMEVSLRRLLVSSITKHMEHKILFTKWKLNQKLFRKKLILFVKQVSCSICIKHWYYTHFFFYIHGSVHRNSILIRSNKMQQYAGIYLLQNYSTCFRCPLHPSSGVHKTVTAISGTGYSFMYSWWWVRRTPKNCRVILQ